ncbi:hypothetical protein AUJ68_01760 [Candidatus Woesearchaeota archaeon CG1_02_57_44]|nr:MAG: hypothetical protein AUJ68_01760 [Candidatus Woesearchaeota archaeon CG1_02_57_44]
MTPVQARTYPSVQANASSPVSFTCKGHPNIRAAHASTIEFTRDETLTTQGDCIIGIACDFTSEHCRSLPQGRARIMLQLQTESADGVSSAEQLRDSFTSEIIEGFNHHEMVFRRSVFHSERTAGIRADKAACNINRSIIYALQNPDTRMTVTIAPADEEISTHAVHPMKIPKQRQAPIGGTRQ